MSRQKAFTEIQNQQSKQSQISRKTLRMEPINHHFQPTNIHKQQKKSQLNNLQGRVKSSKTQIKHLTTEANQLGNPITSPKDNDNQRKCNQINHQIKEIPLSKTRILEKTKNKFLQKIVDNRINLSKSFLIRKKVLSNYQKKKDFSNFQKDIDLHKQIIGEILLANTLQFEDNFFDKKQNKHTNTRSIHNLKELSVIKQNSKCPLTMSSNHHPNALKVKPVICRQSKKNKKLQIKNQEQKMPTNSKDNENKSKSVSMNRIEHMIKKIRKISKCEIESSDNSKNTSIKNNEQSEGHLNLYSNQTIKKGIERHTSRLEKARAFNCCKTIRISWGQHEQHLLNINEESPKQESIGRQVDAGDQEDAFEGFSFLSNMPSCITNIVDEDRSNPIESLREIYLQLCTHEERQREQDSKMQMQ